jgi:hypothetical protein
LIEADSAAAALARSVDKWATESVKPEYMAKFAKDMELAQNAQVQFDGASAVS